MDSTHYKNDETGEILNTRIPRITPTNYQPTTKRASDWYLQREDGEKSEKSEKSHLTYAILCKVFERLPAKIHVRKRILGGGKCFFLVPRIILIGTYGVTRHKTPSD